MDTENYSSIIQWLPKELLEDVFNLAVELNTKKYFEYCQPHDYYMMGTYFDKEYNEDLILLIRTLKKISVDNPDAIPLSNNPYYEYQDHCKYCNNDFIFT